MWIVIIVNNFYDYSVSLLNEYSLLLRKLLNASISQFTQF